MIILTGAHESVYRNFLKDCADTYEAALLSKNEKARVEFTVEQMKIYLKRLLNKDEYAQLVGRISERAAKQQLAENADMKSKIQTAYSDIRSLEEKIHDLKREVHELKEKGAAQHENH